MKEGEIQLLKTCICLQAALMQLQEDSVCLAGFECQQLCVVRVHSFHIQKSLIFAYLKCITHNNFVYGFGGSTVLLCVHVSHINGVYQKNELCFSCSFFQILE